MVPVETLAKVAKGRMGEETMCRRYNRTTESNCRIQHFASEIHQARPTVN